MDRLFSPKKRQQAQQTPKGSHSRKDSSQFYFVPREPGVTSEVRGDEDAVIEVHTDHAHDDTYEPKPVNRSLSLVSVSLQRELFAVRPLYRNEFLGSQACKMVEFSYNFSHLSFHTPQMSQKEQMHRSSGRSGSLHSSVHSSARPPPPADGKPNPLSRTLFALFGGHKPAPTKTFDEEGAKKVDPKIYFSLERTFLAWMKAAIWIAAISIALGSRSASTDAQALYSLFFLGVAIVFIIYSLAQCKYEKKDADMESCCCCDNEHISHCHLL